IATRYPATLQEASKDSVLLFEFLISVWQPQWATFQQWGQALQDARERVRPGGAHPTVGTMHGLALASYSKRLAHYVAASAGVRYWGYASMGLQESEYEVNRHFLRFAEFYFNPEFAPLPPERRQTEITVTGSPRAYVGPMVYERTTATGREMVIHLINLPEESDYFCQRHAWPPPRRDTCIEVRPGHGEHLLGAYAILPFTPEKGGLPGVARLSLQGHRCVLPELREAAAIVLKFQGVKP
ncbi:MAG: hypothetical protein IJJ33_02185, partial [Victivallales bacterium]|nr:hypothetical protein [Victivallales bacterium]